MNPQLKKAIVPSIVLALASTAPAAQVIVNSNFDAFNNTTITLDTDGKAWGDTAAFPKLSGWTIGAGSAGYGMANGADFGTNAGVNEPPYFAGNTGTQLLAADGDTFITSTADGTAVLSQSIGVAGPGTIDLSYSLGKISFATGTLTARVQVFDGAYNTAASLYDVTTDIDALSNITWNTISPATFSNTGTDLFIQITLNDSNAGAQLAIDSVTMDYTAVPEPSSTALLGLGGLALILRRRK